MKELLTFQMPATQPIELGANTIHAIITIDENGGMVGEMMPYQDNKGKMVTPTMPNRGPQVIAIAGSDTVQYFNPDHERHYRSTIDRYEDVLAQFNVPEVSALYQIRFTQTLYSILQSFVYQCFGSNNK